jgi:hypothetical protein
MRLTRVPAESGLGGSKTTGNTGTLAWSAKFSEEGGVGSNRWIPSPSPAKPPLVVKRP